MPTDRPLLRSTPASARRRDNRDARGSAHRRDRDRPAATPVTPARTPTTRPTSGGISAPRSSRSTCFETAAAKALRRGRELQRP